MARIGQEITFPRREYHTMSGFHLEISIWGGSGHGISAHYCTVPPLSLIYLKFRREEEGKVCMFLVLRYT